MGPRRLLTLLGILAASGVVGACRPAAPSPEAVPVARIGDEVITAEEFRLNFEFGHGHLRSGADPRRELLDFMIREKLLAMEAERMNLDTVAAIRHALHTLEEEMLIERVFEEHVLDHIEVSDEEIRDEINRSAVSFRFRFLPALNENDAWAMWRDVNERGWGAVFEDRREAFEEIRMSEPEMTSPLLGADEIEPEILAIIQDLEVLRPSEPVNWNGQWVLFQVVDIRRSGLSEDDYQKKAATYRKVIYNRKAMEGGTQFVGDTMSPLDVRTQREGFDVLNQALWDWYRDEQPLRNLLFLIESGSVDKPYSRLLVSSFDLPLVAFGNEQWDIREFLAHFTPGRYAVRTRDPLDFRARLSDIVALVVRDKLFLDRARQERLHRDEAYQRGLALWKEKWMFQEYKNRLVQDRPAVAARSRLVELTDSLKALYDVEVYYGVLDTLTLSVSEMNPTMTVHLFKSHSNRQAFPIVDPNWKPPRRSAPGPS